MLRLLTIPSRRFASVTGILPPVPTPFFKGNESIDYEKFEKMLRRLDEFPLSGFVILGSNGEFPYLNFDEKVSLVKRARQVLGPSRTVIAGSGAESTKETIEIIKEMANAGANAALVHNPFFYKSRMASSDCCIQHFSRVADNSPIPVLLYNVPPNTALDIPINAIAELAKHDNIIGLKDSGGDIVRITNIIRLTRHLDKSFNVLAGSASFLLPALVVGCVGAISALANVLPAELCKLHQLVQKGLMHEALDLQLRLVTPNAAVTSQYGVPGLKAAMKQFQGIDAGAVRSPLTELPEADSAKISLIFKNSGFIDN